MPGTLIFFLFFLYGIASPQISLHNDVFSGCGEGIFDFFYELARQHSADMAGILFHGCQHRRQPAYGFVSAVSGDRHILAAFQAHVPQHMQYLKRQIIIAAEYTGLVCPCLSAGNAQMGLQLFR